jgi:tetratricopeptide (TPR) repeat protein
MRHSTNQARLLAGIFFIVVMLSGCVAVQTQQLMETPPEKLPARYEITAVPFFAQEAYQCGPAALAMVLNHAGVQVQPGTLTEQVFIPARQGSVQAEMLAAARRNGTQAYELAPQLRDLLAEVAAGHPVLVMQNLAYSWYPKWHYAVAVGYDLPRGEIMLRSGFEQRQVLPMATFEHTWERSGRWAMLALPPGKLPITVDKATALRVAVAMEKTPDKTNAQQTYAALLQQSPTDLVALMGAGNMAYANKDLAAAESYFRRAIAHHPDSGDAWNNLAQTLSDQGRYHEALYAIKKAIPLGGPNQAHYRQTLVEIEQARALAR